jgi:hypothetical protein
MLNQFCPGHVDYEGAMAREFNAARAVCITVQQYGDRHLNPTSKERKGTDPERRFLTVVKYQLTISLK